MHQIEDAGNEVCVMGPPDSGGVRLLVNTEGAGNSSEFSCELSVEDDMALRLETLFTYQGPVSGKDSNAGGAAQAICETPPLAAGTYALLFRDDVILDITVPVEGEGTQCWRAEGY